jgi:hypothetical protein
VFAGEASFTRGKSGHHRVECRVTPGRGDVEESATESIPPPSLLGSVSARSNPQITEAWHRERLIEVTLGKVEPVV